MILEIYFFTFLFCLHSLVYAYLVLFTNVNEDERHLLKLILLIPLVCLILVL